MAQVEMKIDSVRRHMLNDKWVVILIDNDAKRYLPIYIGSPQADIIGRLLMHEEPVDSAYLDISSVGNDLTFSGVESVTISRFNGNVFYSRLLPSCQDKSLEVDCPTAKAIALAVRAEAPIYVDEVVLDEAAIDVRT